MVFSMVFFERMKKKRSLYNVGGHTRLQVYLLQHCTSVAELILNDSWVINFDLYSAFDDIEQRRIFKVHYSDTGQPFTMIQDRRTGCAHHVCFFLVCIFKFYLHNTHIIMFELLSTFNVYNMYFILYFQ